MLRVDAIAATTGHGEPVQKYFALGDGEKIVGVVSHDPRNLPEIPADVLAKATEEDPAPPHVVAWRRGGVPLRVPGPAGAARRHRVPTGVVDGIISSPTIDLKMLSNRPAGTR